MTVLYANLALVTMFALMARYYSLDLGLGSMPIRPNKLFTLLALLTLVLSRDYVQILVIPFFICMPTK